MKNLIRQPSISIGGVSLLLSQAIILCSSATVNSHYDSLRRNGVAYQIPTGFKLVIVAVRFTTLAAGTHSQELGYGDNAVAAQGGIPTNYVAINANGSNNGVAYTGATSASMAESPCYYEVPAGKYPVGRVAGSGLAIWLGYLAKV